MSNGCPPGILMFMSPHFWTDSQSEGQFDKSGKPSFWQSFLLDFDNYGTQKSLLPNDAKSKIEQNPMKSNPKMRVNQSCQTSFFRPPDCERILLYWKISLYLIENC